MAKIKLKRDSSPEALQILSAYSERHEQNKRKSQRLGASRLGRPCERALWYDFRWATEPDFSQETLRIFNVGHREETQILKDMREALGPVFDRDPKTGEQFALTACDGHLVCKVDGLMRTLGDHGPTVVEIKTSSLKQYRKIHTDGCQGAKPEHYVQVQLGMGMAAETYGEPFAQALYVVASKDKPENKEGIASFYTEVIPYDDSEYKRSVAKGLRVIQTQDAPCKISDKPDYYTCKWCDHKEVCHGETVADVSCRTCVHSKPVENGEWACAKHTKRLTPEEQEAACGDHVFLPDMVPLGKPIDAAEDESWVQYEMENGTTFLNLAVDAFPPELELGFAYSSAELRVLPASLIAHPTVELVREHLGARVSAAVPPPVDVDGVD